MQVRNWAGNVRFTPAERVSPASVDEVAALVRRARAERKNIRVTGAGHSFSPLIATDDIFVDLTRMSGLVAVNQSTRRATFLAGTPIRLATRILAQHGLGLANQGDIDRQSLAGAFSTGTHGTGLAYASLANFLTAVEFVDGTGKVQTVDETSPGDLLNAVKVAVGSCGILTSVTIQCVDAFILRCDSRSIAVEDCLNGLDSLITDNTHFEFFWFPYSPLVQLKMSNPVQAQNRRGRLGKFFAEKVVERIAFGSLCEIARAVPALAPRISRFCGSLNPDSDFAEHSWEVFPSERDVIFTEMEYALPLAAGPDCFREIRSYVESNKIPVFFPVEFRVAGPDQAWLSPMYGRSSAIISLHVYKGFRQQEFFSGAETILKRHGGRPHWGKLHQLSAAELPQLYPKWHEFAAIRRQYDPDSLFCNDMLRRYFLV
jgi:FAD-linked oxidoreductase